jgi:di/tricarboxylate transporter
MLTAPSWHAVAALLLTLGMFYAFARTKLRVELICLMLIALLAVGLYFFPVRTGNEVAGIKIAFGGFGHEALIAICSLMILGRGLVVTGALEPAARVLARVWKLNAALGLLLTFAVCAALSMFVNDTPVLVLALPILINLAARTNIPASQTLMPVNAAILLGGMATTIGTSTNLLVVSIAHDLGVPRFGVFQFTGIAVTAWFVALPYIWLVMPRLLPRNSPATAEALRRFNGSLHVTEESKIAGEPFSALSAKLGSDVTVGGVARGWRTLALTSDESVRPNDRIMVLGQAEDLRAVSAELKAPLAQPSLTERIRALNSGSDADTMVAEVVVGAQSSMIGQSVASARIGDRYGVAVLGTYRPSHTIFDAARLATIERLEVGDVLLVQGVKDALRELEIGESVMMLDGATETPRSDKAPIALLIVAIVIAAAAFKIVPIAISALTGTIAMLATGCVKFERIGRALSAEVIVLVAASIALGSALVETGAAAWLGSVAALGLQALPPAAVVAAVITFAAILTNFISNAAAAAVSTPIAVSLSQQLGVPAEPLVAAVLFGANLCFVTPMAYQTNLMIMTVGGYRFNDYVRAGLPLTVLMVAVLSFLLVVTYGL